MPQNQGDPRCPTCHGAGGMMIAGKWRKCDCRRITQAAVNALRKAQERPDRPFRMPWKAE